MNHMFVPADSLNERTHRMQLANGVNAALAGKTHNNGQFTVPAGSGSYLLTDARLGVGRTLLLSPANQQAATLQYYVSEIMNGKCEMFFITPPTQQAIFNFAVIGVGRLKGK